MRAIDQGSATVLLRSTGHEDRELGVEQDYASGAIALMLSSKSPTPSRATLLAHLQQHADDSGYSVPDHGNGLLQLAAMP